ncbi:MAG: hypothetical protein AABW81_03790, partial [Nanoarchaeota archaeon]
SLIAIAIAFTVQFKSQNKIEVLCSYLDPVVIDILAFSGGLFLIADGIYRIWEHKDASLKKQITRSIRVALGFTIVTLHIMQFVHK